MIVLIFKKSKKNPKKKSKKINKKNQKKIKKNNNKKKGGEVFPPVNGIT